MQQKTFSFGSHALQTTLKVQKTQKINDFKEEKAEAVQHNHNCFALGGSKLRYYTGFQQSYQEKINEKTLEKALQSATNDKSESQNLTKKWRGSSSILDRKHKPISNNYENFDQEDLKNQFVAPNQFRLWKNLMNKYIVNIKKGKAKISRKKQQQGNKNQTKIEERQEFFNENRSSFNVFNPLSGLRNSAFSVPSVMNPIQSQSFMNKEDKIIEESRTNQKILTEFSQDLHMKQEIYGQK